MLLTARLRSGHAGVVSPESPSPDRGRLLRFNDIVDARLFRQYVHRVSSWVVNNFHIFRPIFCPFPPRKLACQTQELITLGTQIDVCDRQCHFGIEVPRRAHKFPLLSYGIMAFASAVSMSPDRGAAYHNQAVDILIPILDGPIESLDENVLAAIVLLRAFEEGTGTFSYIS